MKKEELYTKPIQFEYKGRTYEYLSIPTDYSGELPEVPSYADSIDVLEERRGELNYSPEQLNLIAKAKRQATIGYLNSIAFRQAIDKKAGQQ